MKTVYQGIASRSSLATLKIHFPSSRIPRPSIVIPGIPSLKYLHLANLDPLCYNDDVSVLIAEAENLETLKLHWSPRMRQEREPSINMSTYFGRIAASPRKLNLENFSMANLFLQERCRPGRSRSLREARFHHVHQLLGHGRPIHRVHGQVVGNTRQHRPADEPAQDPHRPRQRPLVPGPPERERHDGRVPGQQPRAVRERHAAQEREPVGPAAAGRGGAEQRQRLGPAGQQPAQPGLDGGRARRARASASSRARPTSSRRW